MRNMLVSILREIAGLFVDDGIFALAIVATVLLATLASVVFVGMPLAAGAVLLLGCLAILLATAVMTARR